MESSQWPPKPGRKLIQLCMLNDKSSALKHALQNSRLISQNLYYPLDEQGNSCLHLSILQKDYAMTAFLLSKGANPNVCNKSGITPMNMARQHSDISHLLMKHGAIITEKSEGRLSGFMSTSLPPMNEQRADDMIFNLRQAHTVAKQDLNVPDAQGWTLLMRASYYGRSDLVALLIEKGADTNICNSRGMSPLFLACLAGHLEIVQILIEQGKAAPDGSCTAHHPSFAPLLGAIYSGKEKIARYLVQHHADVQIRFGPKKNRSLVMIAAWLQRVDMIKLLVQRGATVDTDVKLWLRSGAIQHKKNLYRHNIWLNFKPFEVNGRIAPFSNGSTLPIRTRRASVSEDLNILTLKESEEIDQLSNLLIEGVIQTRAMSRVMSLKDPLSTLSKPRQTSSKAQFLENVYDITSKYPDLGQLIAQLPKNGTRLDELWMTMLQNNFQLVKATQRDAKHLYISLAAKTVNLQLEIIKMIEKHQKVRDNLLIHTQLHVDDECLISASNIHSKIKQLCQKIGKEESRQLMLSTRLAIGFWPPENAIQKMVQAFCALVQACYQLILLAKVTGRFDLLDHELEFKVENPDLKTETPKPLFSTDDLNYEDYRRKNELIMLQEMTKALAPSRDELAEDEPVSLHDAFLSSLYSHLSRYVLAMRDLISQYQQHEKDKFITTTSSIHAIADHLLHDVYENETVADLAADILLRQNDIQRLEESGARLEISQCPVSLKSVFQQNVEFLKLSIQKLTIHGRIASGSWPPSSANQTLVESSYVCSLALKKVALLTKEIIDRMSMETSEAQKKKMEWKRECLRNEKVRKIFNSWESSIVSDFQSLDGKRATSEQLLFPDSDEGLVFEESKTQGKIIKGGKLHCLVDRLTTVSVQDYDYMRAFILTHHSFTTSIELMELLKKRYTISPPYGLDHLQFESFINNKLVPVRLSICRILDYWMDTHFREDFLDNDRLISRLQHFIDHDVAKDFPQMASTLENTLAKNLSNVSYRSMSLETPLAPPPLLLPKHLQTEDSLKNFLAESNYAIFDLDPQEIARQLTLLESRLFKNLTSEECLDEIWREKRVKERMIAGIIKAETERSGLEILVEHTNTLSSWIASSVLASTQVKIRGGYLKFFVQMALHCYDLGNLCGVTGIVGGLSMTPISRLHKTWSYFQKKNPKLQEDYNVISDIVSPKHQYASYRKKLKMLSGPAIPFLGVYLTDLTFIELGNPDFLSENHYINFGKRLKVYHLITEIQRFQKCDYPLTIVRALFNFFQSLDPNSEWILNEDELYMHSCLVEPKEENV